MRRIISRGPLAVVAMLALAACSGGAADPTPTATPTGDATPTATAAPTDTTSPDEPDPAAEFDGSELRLVLGVGPGGGLSTMAETIAPHLSRELGVPVRVEYQEGAGGLIMLNRLYASAGDHTVIALSAGSGAAGLQIQGADGVQYDLREFSYLGSPTVDQQVVSTGPTGRFDAAEELLDAERVRMGSAGVGGGSYFDALVLTQVLDLNADIITGFDSSSEAQRAVIANETDLHFGPVSSRLRDIQSGELRALLVLSPERSPALPDVPSITEIAPGGLSDEQMAVIVAHASLSTLGRIFIAPPDIAADQHAVLEAAFQAVVNSEAFVDDITRVMEVTIEPSTGAEVLDLVNAVLDAPASYTDLLTGS